MGTNIYKLAISGYGFALWGFFGFFLGHSLPNVQNCVFRVFINKIMIKKEHKCMLPIITYAF